MRLLLRLVAIVTALSLVGSSSLSAMPLVWCFGKDGHRAVEAMLHQHGIEASDALTDVGIPTGTDDAPCSDWQLLNAAGTPLAKGLHAEPKALVPVSAFPPLKTVVGASFPPNGRRHGTSLQPRPGAQLSVLRSVVLLI